MGRTSASFGGGQGATAAALTLRLIQNISHGEEHIPDWDAFHGECCGLVIGDQFLRGEWLGLQSVFVCGGRRPSNIGWPKEGHARGPKQCGQMTGSGVVANHHGRVLYGQQGRVETGFTDHLRLGNVFGHLEEAVLLIGRPQECDAMTSGLELLSQRDET